MVSDGCSVPAMLKKLIPALQDFADKCDKTDCALHDMAYELGGSKAARIDADYELFLGAREKCGDEVAVAVFNAVRYYGSAHWGSDRKWHGGERAWPETPEAG